MTVYEIQIKYTNKDTWDKFFEYFTSKKDAETRLLVVQGRFPKNKFRLKPVSCHSS